MLLVVERDLGLGDFLTGVPALRALARAFPRHRRVLVASGAFAPLLELTGTGFELAREVPEGVDVAVNLHGRGPQSHARLLAARPRRLIAFACGAHRGPEWRAGEHEVARWCRLLNESGIPADPGDLSLHLRVRASGATIIHPGAASAARRWPEERWAAVAGALARAGRRVEITAGAGERALAERVAETAARGAEARGGAAKGGGGPAITVADTPDLGALAAAVAAADEVVCGDTGVAHLATALGTPSLVLFGPTPPSEWGPPADRPCHRVLWAGRRGDPHATARDPGLLAITVDDVLAALGLGSPTSMSLIDKITGRFKKAAGDIADDPALRRKGRREERKGEAKDELAAAHEKADRKAEEVANLERRT